MERNRNTRRQAGLITAFAAFLLVGSGCAISDYRGYLNHATSNGRGEAGNGYTIGQFGAGGSQTGIVGEAKLWGSDVAISTTPDPEGMSGTFSYTVEYDFRGRSTAIGPTEAFPSPIIITTYRNRVLGAFNPDGFVDRDGDDIRLSAGNLGNHDPADPAGIFERRWLFVDRAQGCQFFANFEQAFTNDKKDNQGATPAIVVCFTAPSEEVDDRDIDLSCTPGQEDRNPATPACKAFSQDAFASLDDLFKKIWSGSIGAFSASGAGFTLEATSVTINGNKLDLSNAAVIDMEANGVRPVSVVVDLTSAGGQELIKALLSNTTDKQVVALGFGFLGGMAIDVPHGQKIVLNHDQLRSLLN
jgi:hypothetical protein